MDFDQITKPIPIGQVTEEIIRLLGCGNSPGVIFIGPSNIKHMKKNHPDDFVKYSMYIQDILQTPDFVGENPNNGSLQFVKLFDDNVLVAVRLSSSGVYFARSLYVITETKLSNYRKSGRLIPFPK